MARSGGAQLALEPLGPPPEERRPVRASHSGAGPWRRRLRIGSQAALGLILTAACLAALRGLDRWLASEPRFALPGSPQQPDGLRIEGLRNAPPEEVLAVFASDFGRSVYRIPLSVRRRRLLQIDWVRQASVRRRWPNRLAVVLEERTPVAFALLPAPAPGAGYQTALIDAEGVLLRLPPRGDFALPVLRGLRADQPAAERRQGVAWLLRLLEEAQPLAAEISEVDVSDPENLTVILWLEGRALRLWLGQENFGARLKRFRDYYPQVRPRAGGAEAFDLRVEGQITLVAGRPAGGAAAQGAPARPAPPRRAAERKKRGQ